MRNPLFSERYGIVSTKVDIQLESMDDDLRRELWNWMYRMLEETPINQRNHVIHTQLFKKALHTFDFSLFKSQLFNYSKNATWYEIYDLIELTLAHQPESFTRSSQWLFIDSKTHKKERYIQSLNEVLENNLAGYRYSEGLITPITSPAQIASIEQTFETLTTPHFTPVHEHLKKALEFYSNRQKPDYANSVREAVTALESLVKLMAKTDMVDMGKVKQLLNLENDPKLASSIVSLWGYASEKPGVRHAATDNQKPPTASEALLVLSTSASLISYLIATRGANQV